MKPPTGASDRRLPPRRALAAWLPVLLATAAFTPGATAQVPGRPEAKRLAKEQREGVVIEKGAGWLVVRLPRESATLWQVVPAADAKIQVVGPASRAMLAPRQFIRVAVTLDDSGKVTAPVDKVTFPGGGTPAVIAPGLGIDGGARRVPGRRAPGLYTVNGIVREVDGDTVTVVVGKERFVFTVPADAELVVDTPMLAIVDKNDAVEVEGTYVEVGQLLASEIKVTLSKPLTPPDPKARAAKR